MSEKTLKNFSFHLLGRSVWFINSCELLTVKKPNKKQSILIIVALPLVVSHIKMAATRHMMWCTYCGIFTFPSYVFPTPDIVVEFPRKRQFSFI